MPTAVTFLGFVPLCFALILEAHGTLVHLVHLNAKLASKALGIICQRPRGEEKKVQNRKTNFAYASSTFSLFNV